MANISPDAQAVLAQAGEGAQQYVLGKGGFGNTLTSGEATSLLSGFTPKPNVGQQVQSGIAALGSQQFEFNAQDYLPAIQQEANSLYSPQQAQLSAIRELQQSQAVDTKIQTEKDFKKRLQAETEAINARGAYFSGGAIQNEQDIRDQQARVMQQITLQQQAADFSIVAQQAGLSAEQAKYVKDQLFNAQGGAYQRFNDQRQFQFQALQAQYQVYSQERGYARSVFESDRSYDQSVKQFQAQYKMSQDEFKLSQAKFKQDTKQWNEQFAFDKFKYEQAQKDGSGQGTEKDLKNKVATYAAAAINGTMTREAAAGLVNVFYPGKGYMIYDAVPDGVAKNFGDTNWKEPKASSDDNPY